LHRKIISASIYSARYKTVTGSFQAWTYGLESAVDSVSIIFCWSIRTRVLYQVVSPLSAGLKGDRHAPGTHQDQGARFPVYRKNSRAPGFFEPQKIVGAKCSSNYQNGNSFCGFPLARASPSWLKAWAYRHSADHRYRLWRLSGFPISVGGF